MAYKIKKNSDLKLYTKLSLSEGAKIYAELRLNISKTGILDRTYGYYFIMSLIDFGGFIFFVYQLFVQTHPLLVIISTTAIAYFSVRIGGLVHDAGHRAIFKSVKNNDLYGHISSLLIAFPYSVWRIKHNAHHAHTNEEGGDPDLEVPISFTEEMYNRNAFVVRTIRKHQAWFYHIFGSMVSFTMRLKSLKFYKKNFNPNLYLEIIFFLGGLFVWYILPFFVFPFWKALSFFIVVNLSAGFYMLHVFAPNHKGMPQLEKGVKISFIEHQIMTSRNLYAHWFTDYIYLGLNYQIEHHLFPNCPRHKLGLITPYVMAICKKYKLGYTQLGILESTRFILSELKKVSKSEKS